MPFDASFNPFANRDEHIEEQDKDLRGLGELPARALLRQSEDHKDIYVTVTEKQFERALGNEALSRDHYKGYRGTEASGLLIFNKHSLQVQASMSAENARALPQTEVGVQGLLIEDKTVNTHQEQTTQARA